MSLFVWIMMGIAVWHFAVWVPDRFWGGIVGALLGSVIGAIIVGFIAAGFSIIGRHDLAIAQAFEAIPGAVIGLAICWYYGRYTETHPKPKHHHRRGRGGTARARA